MALPFAFLSLPRLQSRSLLLLLLLLWEQLTVAAPTNWTSQQGQTPRPSPADRCGPDEYWSAGHCCLCCPTGEFVCKHCSHPHTWGQCEKCDRDEFTAFPNGLESCLLCSTCSNDLDVVAECTVTNDWTCQCRAGRFYKAPGNEEFCTRCSTCPEGTVVLQQCNSMADTVCGPPGPESRNQLCLIGSFTVLLAVCLGIIIIFMKKPKDGGFQPVCNGLPRGIQDGGERLGPESSVSSEASHGTPEADPPGPTTEDRSLSAGSLDLALEAPTPPSTPESPAGVQGLQAAVGDKAGPCTTHHPVTPHCQSR